MSAGNNEYEHEHKQAPILENGEEIFTVDERLQSLIQFLWDQGFTTYNSCQDNVRNTAWIQYDLSSWMVIVETAFQGGAKELVQFIEEECQVDLLFFDDGEPDENDEFWIEGENLVWSASVRFPKKKINQFEALLRVTLDDE